MSEQKVGWAPRLEFKVHLRSGRRGRRILEDGPSPEPELQRETLPRVTRLLALAHRWRDLIERGEVVDQAEIAALMGITRARVTQIMNLQFLSPDIRERLLSEAAAAPSESDLRRVLKHELWRDQEAALPRSTVDK